MVLETGSALGARRYIDGFMRVFGVSAGGACSTGKASVKARIRGQVNQQPEFLLEKELEDLVAAVW